MHANNFWTPGNNSLDCFPFDRGMQGECAGNIPSALAICCLQGPENLKKETRFETICEMARLRDQETQMHLEVS